MGVYFIESKGAGTTSNVFNEILETVLQHQEFPEIIFSVWEKQDIEALTLEIANSNIWGAMEDFIK